MQAFLRSREEEEEEEEENERDAHDVRVGVPQRRCGHGLCLRSSWSGAPRVFFAVPSTLVCGYGDVVPVFFTVLVRSVILVAFA